MEVEIDSKKNNPLLNRTEIYFTIKHLGEKTPNREIIRAELADKLNAKKEDVIIDSVHTTFGIQEITGYAKIYSSPDKLKGLEREHILVRNKLMQAKKKEKKEGAKAFKPAEGAKEEAKPGKVEPKAEAPKSEPLKKESKDKPAEPQPKEKKE
jgi:small subunit ribosomal protein S24e